MNSTYYLIRRHDLKVVRVILSETGAYGAEAKLPRKFHNNKNYILVCTCGGW